MILIPLPVILTISGDFVLGIKDYPPPLMNDRIARIVQLKIKHTFKNDSNFYLLLQFSKVEIGKTK